MKQKLDPNDLQRLVLKHGEAKVLSIVVDGEVDFDNDEWRTLIGVPLVASAYRGKDGKVLPADPTKTRSKISRKPTLTYEAVERIRRPFCVRCDYYLSETDECGYNKNVRNKPARLKSAKGIGNPRSRCPLPEPKFVELNVRVLPAAKMGDTACVSDLGGGSVPPGSASISVSDSENQINIYASDSHDAIQAKINTSPDSSTLYWHDGNYNITSPFSLKGGRKYLGQSWNALIKTTGNFHAFAADGDDWQVRNLSFDGAGIRLASTRVISQWVVDNCQFTVRSQGSNGQLGIVFESYAVTNGQITNSRWSSLKGTGIYGYYYNNLLIANNEFYDGDPGYDAIHIINHDNKGSGLILEQNYGTNLNQMFMELQAGGNGVIIRDNWYEHPKIFSTYNQNDSCFAYSAILDQSTGTRIYRNYCYAPERADGTGLRTVFEVGGDNCLVEDNYSDYGNNVVAGNDENGTTSVTVRNNHFTNYLIGVVGRGITQYNNGNIPLTWSPSRGRPHRNQRYASV